MAVLEIEDLKMSIAGKELYSDADFKLEKGDHIGIVGQNGVGKSTLVKLLTKELLPDTGKIHWQKKVKIGYLDQYSKVPKEATLLQFLRSAYQDLYDTNEKMSKLYQDYAESFDEKKLQQAGNLQQKLERENFYALDTFINQVVQGLGLDKIGLDHPLGEMSGGQRAKAILAKLILSEPDVLILDEPTNYLDTAHINWLIKYLQDFKGSYLVVSHDYDFLDKVTNGILNISFNRFNKYHGNFFKAMRQKEEKEKAQVKAYDKQQLEITKAKNFISKNKAGSKATQAKSREKMLKNIKVVQPPKHNKQATFSFPYLSTDSLSYLVVNNLVVGYQTPLLKPVTFSINSQQKIGLVGFNGAGKSTLIKTLLGRVPKKGGEFKLNDSVKINYFSQELDWPNKNMTPMAIMQEHYPKIDKKAIITKLSQVGLSHENIMNPIATLSGGEQTKVKLAIMELKKSNLLIMDEPSNHLDEETKEALQKSLKDFSGSVLLVSHEESFLNNAVDKVINIGDLSLKEH